VPGYVWGVLVCFACVAALVLIGAVLVPALRKNFGVEAVAVAPATAAAPTSTDPAAAAAMSQSSAGANEAVNPANANSNQSSAGASQPPGGIVGTSVGAAPLAPPAGTPAPAAVAPAPVAGPLAPAAGGPAEGVPGQPAGPQSNSAAASPPAQSGVRTDATIAVPALRYQWKPGEKYAYAFQIKAEINGGVEESSGMTMLTVNDDPSVMAKFDVPSEDSKGSGSGFVVSADGYIVTCAHVVEGSVKIDVQVAGQTLAGEVVAFDKLHDLAVVRVRASNLPVLAIGNSDSVELAEEVRAVGFPLSDVLGESVKITRGTIAGIVESSGKKVFQVDASINPGNSGGPMVNQRGYAIGVASAKLSNEAIDNVGFVVTSNDVKTLLRSKGLPFQEGAGGPAFEGPELARRVTPAVALLKVTCGAGGVGTVRRRVLNFNGNLSASGRSLPGSRTPPKFESGMVLTNEAGEVLDATGNTQLPYLFGALGSLPIEPLSSDGERTWQTQRASALTQVIGQESPQDHFPTRFRRSRGRQAQPKVAAIVVIPALETAAYEMGAASGDQLTIRKRYEFKTLQKPGTPTLAHVTGEGTITFDQRLGVPVKLEYRATVVRSVGNITVTIPVTLNWNRLDQKVLDDALAKAKEAQAAAPRPGATASADSGPGAAPSSEVKPAPAAPPTAKEVDRLLAELTTRGKNFSQKYIAASALSRMKPLDERRAKVTKAVEPLMRDSNAGLRDAAIRTMGVWGTKANVPALLKMLDQLDFGIRLVTMEALGRIPDQRSAKALAKLVLDTTSRNNAAAALKKMGLVAESAVIALLDDDDHQVRYQAYHILAEIGGKKSVAAITERLKTDGHVWSHTAAEIALRKLNGKQETNQPADAKDDAGD